MMLVQTGGCCAQYIVRGTFALSSILKYRNVMILAIYNYHVTPREIVALTGLFLLPFFRCLNEII